MNCSDSGNPDRDDRQAEYENALLDYEQAIQAIEAAGESVAAEQIEAAIIARARIHAALTEERLVYKQSLSQAFTSVLRALFDLLKNCLRVFVLVLQKIAAALSGQSRQMQHKLHHVRKLDNALRARSRTIRRVVKVQRVVPLSNLHEVLETPQPQWLRLFKSSKPWHDRYDWLWRGISLICFIWAIALLVDTVNRFLTGGVSTGGVAAILGTVFLTLLSSGGVLTSFGQGELEKIFESFEISPKWWDELRCLLSVLALILLILFRHYGLPIASTCYAREPQWLFVHCFASAETIQGTGSNKKVTVQESRYHRAIALKPDNFEAYFGLANLYERELDYDNALKTYQMASRVSNPKDKQKAEIAITEVLIKKEDLKSADERLTQILDSSAPNLLSDEQYEILKQLGTAYLGRGRQNRSALQQFQVYLGQSVSPDRFAQMDQSIAPNDDLAAAVKWFSEGIQRTDRDNLQTYQMLTFLAWTNWEQHNWGGALSNATDAVAREKEISLKERRLLPSCLVAHTMVMNQGQSIKQSLNFRQAWSQCAAGKPANDAEFSSITQQLQQLNKPFQPF